MNDVKSFLEMVREKRNKVRRMEEALAEKTARAESVTGLSLGEKVQTSNKATIDAMLAAIEEERKRLADAQKELEDVTEKAKALINTIRDDEIAWQILWHRYILGETWNVIAKRMNYSRWTVMRLADEGIAKINKSCYIVLHNAT